MLDYAGSSVRAQDGGRGNDLPRHKHNFLDLADTCVYICAMHVGVCTIRLRMPENGSLKDKRHVIKAITGRVKNKFNVSIAETDDNDNRQLATLGIACISNDNRHANEVLSKTVDFITDIRFEAEILDYHMEIIPVSDMEDDNPFPADYP